MNDEQGFTPPRPAIPVRMTKQEERIKDALVAAQYPEQKALERKLRAKRAWQTRRANATIKSTPDRHRTDIQLTIAEAIELANLIAHHPVLRKVLP